MFFERPESGEKAILVHMEMSAKAIQESPRELEELALSAGADPVEILTVAAKGLLQSSLLVLEN